MSALRRRRLAYSVLTAGLLLAAGACAPGVRFQEDLNDYEGTIEELQREVAQDPENADALRDLGVIYLRTNTFNRANEYLQLAFSRDPDDPKTLYYLGLTNEALGRHDAALRLYERYSDFSRVNPYRRLLAGRYSWVLRKRMLEEVQQRVAQESDLTTEVLEPRIVAVYPLAYQGADEQYEPIGRGLAELISIDLGHVGSLRLVERSRLQALLDEIELGQTVRVDPATAPRVGRLIGAGRLVGGVYNVLSGDNLRLDATLWETDRQTIPNVETQTDALRNFFDLEKRIVFALLDEMGITLSPQERQRIEFIPTQNLQAFLAFSRGLESEDAGDFDAAAQFYQQAVQLDPSFQVAQDHADQSFGQAELQVGNFQNSLTAAVAAAYRQDPVPALPTVPGVSPMTNRLVMLNGALGSFIIPGVDAREGASETGGAEGTFGTGLPDPPDPPAPPTGGGGN